MASIRKILDPEPSNQQPQDLPRSQEYDEKRAQRANEARHALVVPHLEPKGVNHPGYQQCAPETVEPDCTGPIQLEYRQQHECNRNLFDEVRLPSHRDCEQLVITVIERDARAQSLAANVLLQRQTYGLASASRPSQK